MQQHDKYKYFGSEDFANDEGFWLWVVEGNPDQAAFWTGFLQENPGKRADIEKARQLVMQLNQSTDYLPEARVNQLWERIQDTRQNLPEEKPARVYSLVTRRNWLTAAAVITLFIMSGALGWFWWNKPNLVTVATTYGQRQEFKLPDGSVVMLNANSNLRYRAQWRSHQDREVWLTGEGYFAVKPQPNKQRFMVYAGSVKVQVLGTTFNVNHRRSETKVVLRSGLISLSPQKTEAKPLLLKPGDLVSYREQEARFIRQTVDPESYLTWKNNLLRFEAETLKNIFQLLQDQYNLEITTNDPAILNRKFTGTVPADDLSVLFMGLQEGHNLEINQTGNKVLVKHRLPGKKLPVQD